MQKRQRILHCLRAPVGGLFRHVLDLANAQAANGHDVGIVADATSSDTLTRTRLGDIEPSLSLGLHLIPMSRKPGLGDFSAARSLVTLAADAKADVVHGHGAKGGAYARIAARYLKARGRNVLSFYTPHGGSLHFDPTSIEGWFYLTLEKILLRFTDGVLFESAFAQRTYQDRIGLGDRNWQVVPNGVGDDDFGQHQPDLDAADFLFIGELRHLKGVDVMLDALAQLNKRTSVSATFVGGGPDAETFQNQAFNLGLADVTAFPGPMPAKTAFTKGRCLVVPSRAESFPYIVLEAGAMAMPLIATDVGGIPEMVTGLDQGLIPPDDINALRQAMDGFLGNPEAAGVRARIFQDKVRQDFSIARMSDDITDFYTSVGEPTGSD